MIGMALADFHRNLSARFTEVNGLPAVAHYGDAAAEHEALRTSAGVLDLSFRGRLCLIGKDRQGFLNGQVTNDVKKLRPGQGCYAAITNHKGRMQGDLFAHVLADEVLLDFEPGYTGALKERLEKHIIADDVQVLDVTPHYGLLSLQGPKAGEIVAGLSQELGFAVPAAPPRKELPFMPPARGPVHPPMQVLYSTVLKDAQLGEVCIVKNARLSSEGFDFFAPVGTLAALATRLIAAASKAGGRMCGWNALELARIEAGIPRYGADMTEVNLPTEAGIEARAISYTKGCYIGQEIIARLKAHGHVNRSLVGLRLSEDLKELPKSGEKLWDGNKEVGTVTSAVYSPSAKGNIALGYVRREVRENQKQVTFKTAEGEQAAVQVVTLPFGVES